MRAHAPVSAERNRPLLRQSRSNPARVAWVLIAALIAMLASSAVSAALQDEVFGDGFDGFDLSVCDASLASNSAVAAEYAAALDVCQTTTESAHSAGLISASFTLADNTGTPAAISHSIRPAFGTNNVPRYGSALVVLSTGAAAAPAQTNPSFVAFQEGANNGKQSLPPSDWFTAHNNTYPAPPGCPAASGIATVDPVMLTLRLRVPSNARSFSLDANLFIADFPEFICSSFNDFFVALLDSSFAGNPANPADKNLANYIGFPLNASLAYANTGLFTQCVNGPIGCEQGAIAGTITTCTGTTGLVGTGMDTADTTCNPGGGMVGGGTGWLVMRGNVVPGETIQLRLAIWDIGDFRYDSLILLDHLRWSYSNVTPGLTLN